MRQSNKMKTPAVFRVALALLCLALLTCNMMSDIYARYSASATGSASARVASIDCSVNYEFSGYTLEDIDFDAAENYAVIEEFTVTNTGEVAYTYTLDLKLSVDSNDASFSNTTTHGNFSLVAPDKVDKYLPDNSTAPNNIQSGKAYYAFSTDGTSYTWNETELTGDILSVSQTELSMADVHYYKVIYFVTMSTNLSSGESINSPQMALFYNITCEQID